MPEVSNEVNIAMILDDAYLMCSLCTIYSLKKNKKKNSVYNLFLFLNDVSLSAKRLLNKLSSYNFNVMMIDASVERFKNVSRIVHITQTALIKFNLSGLLSNLDKVLYIDGDIIVQKDLTDLYNMDVSDYYLAGVRELRAEKKYKFHKLVGQKYYINSGVMLMNLDLLRKDNLEQVFIDTKLNQPKEWKCMDQDVFNYVCGAKIKYLGVEYNNPCIIFVDSGTTIDEINSFYNTKYKTIKDLCKNSYILHYAGPPKPWLYEIPYHSKLYSRYLLNCKVPLYEKPPWFTKIFSVSNLESKTHTVIKILDIRIKIRRRNSVKG